VRSRSLRAHPDGPRHRAGRAARSYRSALAGLLLMVLATGGVLAGAPLFPGVSDRGALPVDVDQPRRPDAQVGPGLVGAQPVHPGAVVKRKEPRAVPEAGSGEFEVAAAPDLLPGSADVAYTVEVERPLPFTPAEVAREVEATLRDPRSWGGRLGVTLRRVEARPGLRILLATPATTDALCAPLDTAGRVSCRNGPLVVLNAVRWASAVPWYADAVSSYRTYVVNHEVGHALGRPHQRCPGPGSPAPVMQQQTYGLQGCRRSVWPSPAEVGGS